MSTPRRTALVALAAVLGIAVAAAITYGTSQLVRQHIGLASEPLTAGRSLLAPVSGTATTPRVSSTSATGRSSHPQAPITRRPSAPATAPAREAAPAPALRSVPAEAPASPTPAAPESGRQESRGSSGENARSGASAGSSDHGRSADD
ncbi:MAG TPA: hypothetical protein VN772_05195 [Solirubrobacteraceae bacterium]|nr:hypothetical protein [Solirubrobacteraceae bacterium]